MFECATPAPRYCWHYATHWHTSLIGCIGMMAGYCSLLSDVLQCYWKVIAHSVLYSTARVNVNSIKSGDQGGHRTLILRNIHDMIHDMTW